MQKSQVYADPYDRCDYGGEPVSTWGVLFTCFVAGVVIAAYAAVVVVRCLVSDIKGGFGDRRKKAS